MIFFISNMDPILLDIPEVIESERLVLRCPRAGDGRVMFESAEASRAELNPWMAWSAKQTLDDAELFARRSHAEFILRESLPYLIFRREDGAHVGNTGLHFIDWDVPCFEIGYWCCTTMTGKGYITEATTALERLAFDTLHAKRVEIRVDDRNEKSWRIPERLGYTLEGVLRNDALGAAGEVRNTRIYAKVR
jgi:RimJ/RimL family protein N-acetyltransferase